MSIWDAVFGTNYHVQDEETGEWVEIPDTPWLGFLSAQQDDNRALDSLQTQSKKDYQNRQNTAAKQRMKNRQYLFIAIAAICIIYIIFKRKK